jgi:DNA-binding SARP family transcriptional activator
MEGADVEFALLGPLEVRDGDRLVDLPSRQVRRLLAALVLAPNRVVSTDRLFEVLWGVEPPESAANTLQTYVLHLRNALVPGRGRRDPGRYVLRKEPGYLLAVAPEEIDAARFRDLVDRGRDALAQAPERAAALLRDALELWRGDPLADFTFELFVQPTIVELCELRMQALESRIDAELALGRHAALIGELRELVREQPMRERMWAQLMLCLYRSGRQAEALATFTRVRELLVDQLGVEPSPVLARVHLAMLNQDPSVDWSPSAQPLGRTTATGAPAPRDEAQQGRAGVQAREPIDGDPLRRGMEALQRRDWAQASASLSTAEARAELDGEALDGLAEATMPCGWGNTSAPWRPGSVPTPRSSRRETRAGPR